MSGQPTRGYLGISEVLAELRPEFPDVSVSKIRFLETEGLIAPARSPAGYRRFCSGDVDRLRFILAAQRDQYLPLRVIRERLARLDQHTGSAGQADPSAVQPGRSQPASNRVAAASAVPAAEPMLSRRELLEVAGLTEALLTELETFGLLRRVGRNYGPEALEVARTAVALTSFGVEARHLRAVRAAAERETTMIESLVAPIQRQRGAHDLAARTARDCAVLVLRLHAALVDGALTEAGLSAPAGSGMPAVSAVADQPLERARGVEGATA